MNIEDRKEALKYIKGQLEDGYIDLGLHDENELKIIEEAMCALACLEQYKWERDIAVEQLKEIGIDFGEKVDDVVKVVRCKDCKYRGGYDCPIYHEEFIDWDDDGYHECDYVVHDETHDNGFCDLGTKQDEII